MTWFKIGNPDCKIRGERLIAAMCGCMVVRLWGSVCPHRGSQRLAAWLLQTPRGSDWIVQRLGGLLAGRRQRIRSGPWLLPPTGAPAGWRPWLAGSPSRGERLYGGCTQDTIANHPGALNLPVPCNVQQAMAMVDPRVITLPLREGRKALAFRGGVFLTWSNRWKTQSDQV